MLTHERHVPGLFEGRPLQILLAAEQESCTEWMSRMLGNCFADRVRVAEAPSLDRAVEALAGERFDLCILDCPAPGRTVTDMAADLEEAGVEAPLMLLVAAHDHERRETARDRGMECLLRDHLEEGTLEAAVIRAVSLARERQARLAAEKALAETTALLETAVESLPDHLFVIDREMRMVLSNWKEQDHLPEEERRCGKPCYETLAGRDKPCPGCKAPRVFVTGEAMLNENVNPSTGRIQESSLVPITDEQGEVVMVVKHTRDVTDLRRAQAVLRRSHEDLELRVAQRTSALESTLQSLRTSQSRSMAIIRSIPDGLVVLDEQDRIAMVNKVGKEMLDLHWKDSYAGAPLSAVLGRDRRDGLMGHVRRTRREGGEVVDLSCSEAREAACLQASSSRFDLGDGGEEGVVFLLRDVTRERALDRLKTDFISTAAHELRTPLTSIQGFSEILLTRDDVSEEDRDRYLRHINNTASGLDSIISDILDISRIESGRGFTIQRDTVEMGGLVRAKAAGFAEISKRHEITCETPEGELWVRVDGDKIEQVLDNLISNAVKYSPRGGPVRVRLEQREEETVLEVRDEGVGMSPEQIEHVFERFYRVKSQADTAPGLGLGMAIVEHIVDAHGGSIDIDSEPGRGSTVRVTLPGVAHGCGQSRQEEDHHAAS